MSYCRCLITDNFLLFTYRKLLLKNVPVVISCVSHAAAKHDKNCQHKFMKMENLIELKQKGVDAIKLCE